MSFLEKEEGEKSGSFWDWVVGIGLLLLIAGFTFYYQFQKRASASRFQEADAVYKAGKFKDAGQLYEALKSAQYLTTRDDSTIYARLDTIETAQEQQNAAVVEAKKRAAAGDTAGLGAQLAKLPHRDLLSPEDQAWVDSALGRGAVAAKP
jgi:predicted negative regulator of RcsB-dependent stress response